MRPRFEIEAEHNQICRTAATGLRRLAAEHQDGAGYLTSAAVAWNAQARKIEDYVITDEEKLRNIVAKDDATRPPIRDPEAVAGHPL